MARKNATVVCTIDNADNTMTFSAVGHVGTAILDITKLTSEVSRYAMFHGLKQKVSDAAALEKGASAEDKFEEMRKVVNHLNDGGAWTARIPAATKLDGATVEGMIDDLATPEEIAAQRALIAKMRAQGFLK